MIEQINEQLNELLDSIVADGDEHASKVAEHIQKINALHASGEIDEQARNELLEDANQIIEVEKEASALEAKAKLEQASRLILKLIKMV